MKRPRKRRPARHKAEPSNQNTRKRLPKEPAPGDKVYVTARISLSRKTIEALALLSIREGKDVEALVAEILEAAASRK